MFSLIFQQYKPEAIMGKKSALPTFTDCAMNPLPANITLLVNIANETGHTYAEAFAVWQVCHHQKDAYLIVDTVLWIAKRHNISAMAAFDLYKGVEDQFGQL